MISSRMRPLQMLFLSVLMACALAAPAQTTPDFPELTGRVVDDAHMLDATSQQKLTQMLAAAEDKTGDQVVVVTLPNLGGLTIENYGYRLGRHWGIGDKKKNNGALLIIAKAEHKIRIEVGYGLEGRLTDAQSSVIIHRIIEPAFKQGNFAGGIINGAAAIVQVLGGNPQARAKPQQKRRGDSPSLLHTLGFFGLMVAIILMFGGGGGGGRGGRRRRRGMPWFVPLPIGGGGFGGRGGFGGGMGGGFGGGGGSFGGGGASGGW